MELTRISDIKELLLRHGFRFSKAMGQNFLADSSVPVRIVSRSGISKEHGVLEIGPGIGALTSKLCEAAGKVVSIELDRSLAPVLGETLANCENLKIIYGDALKLPLADIVRTELTGLRPAACANLPYYITTPAITALIEAGVFDTITIMVQREVARRICAAPGSSEYGAFTVFINYHAVPEILFDVPSGCFIPAPKVDSSVIMLRMREEPPVKVDDERLFRRVVRAAFAQRRKTFVNALSHELGDISKAQIAALLAALGLPETVRGETFGLEIFASISNALYKKPV